VKSAPRRFARSLRGTGQTALGLARLSLGLRSFARESISLEQAEAAIRAGLERREAALLETLQGAIFANRRSPYLQLFQAAGCELDDVRRLVRQEGVEGALQRLLEAGIYVSFEEFKGQAPAVRGSQTFSFEAEAFDNPLLTPHLIGATGGSRGRPTRIKLDLELIAQMAPHWAVWFAEHCLLAEPLVFVQPYYPAAITHQLMAARFGNRFWKWFSTGGGGSLSYRLVSAYVHGAVRLATGLPGPEPVAASELLTVGAYLADLAATGRRPGVNTTPSMAARISLQMVQHGRSLRGVTFLLGAEPLTEPRKESIERSGARATITYGFSEGGNVGNQCRYAERADAVHVSLDTFAVLQRPRLVASGDTVPALLMTTFRPASPLVLLNAEIGDYAAIERRACGCRFGRLGYTQQLHTVRSYGKLTGDGVTFLDADIIQVLEDSLPRAFGGSLADYQLVETQSEQGLPRYELLVSPALGRLDERALAAQFLEALSGRKRPYQFMVNQWVRSGAFRVRRDYPQVGARGKLLPFRTLGSR
jgi:hypothetical protein